jgi:hypothetical protein
MNEAASLERGYRRVLAWYPRAFRQENEQEILTVLLASAKDGQRRIGLAETAALIRGALRMRLRPAGRPPRAVRGAVRLACVAAAAELASVLTMVVTAGTVKAALAAGPGLTAAQWHAAAGMLTFREIAAGVVTVIWLQLAWALSQGRDVARFGLSALFALITLSMIIALAQHSAAYAPADTIAGGVTWAIALASAVLSFTRPANTYYRQVAGPPLAPAAG